jgi:hypothetical protein
LRESFLCAIIGYQGEKTSKLMGEIEFTGKFTRIKIGIKYKKIQNKKQKIKIQASMGDGKVEK